MISCSSGNRYIHHQLNGNVFFNQYEMQTFDGVFSLCAHFFPYHWISVQFISLSHLIRMLIKPVLIQCIYSINSWAVHTSCVCVQQMSSVCIKCCISYLLIYAQSLNGWSLNHTQTHKCVTLVIWVTESGSSWGVSTH